MQTFSWTCFAQLTSSSVCSQEDLNLPMTVWFSSRCNSGFSHQESIQTFQCQLKSIYNCRTSNPSAVRRTTHHIRITNKRIPSPGGRERHKEPLMNNRVFRVTSVKGCPDATHPAYCPLTSAPAPNAWEPDPNAVIQTFSKNVSGLCGLNTSLQVITVTRFSVSDRLMMLCVQPGIM